MSNLENLRERLANGVYSKYLDNGYGEEVPIADYENT